MLWLMPTADVCAGESWSLKPLSRPTPPREGHPIDAFILDKLAEKGLRQNDPADPHTLLRRMTLDLTGLPPTREEIDAFLAETADPESAIDRLLASPHYGERWGRHWLDVARYVQTAIKVPGVDDIDLAQPYRDYVVRSFNEDKPYDRFVVEQLAGDQIENGDPEDAEDFDRLIAPAFLSIGQWFDECTDPNKLRLDIVDEQISAATRAFLAMDFACARCHDHKFDPIPIRDYYALAGIFRSTEITEYFSKEWKDGRPRALRALAVESDLDEAMTIDREREALIEERFNLLAAARDRISSGSRFEISEIPGTVMKFEAEDFDGHKDLKIVSLDAGEVIASRRRLDQWVRYRLTSSAEGEHTLLVRYAATESAPVDWELNGVTAPERVLNLSTHGESAEHFRWEAVSLPTLKAGTNFLRFKVSRNERFPTLDRFILVKGALEEVDPGWRLALGTPTVAETRSLLDNEEEAALASIESRIAALSSTRPVFPQTLAVRDHDQPFDLAIHPGGDVYSTEGDPVPRGNPSLAGSALQSAYPVPQGESGRLQFARWLTHPDHPLTARVMANRIWHWHFGTGLVRTTDDFGKQGSPPTHPELLDWLACELIESGWSVKHLHHLIMRSDTYRASSVKTTENSQGDPDGLLLSRFPVRRLEVEAIFDSMLTSIGKVPRQASGSALDTSRSKDRALYILTSSRSPLGLGIEIRKMFPLFGFDDSGRPMHVRDESTTPAQSLWWLNNPLPRHYAETLAKQLIAAYPSPEERALALHETVLGRPPDPEAEAAILRYASENISSHGLTESDAWTRICLGLFSSRTFRQIE